MNDKSYHLARLLTFAGQLGSAIPWNAESSGKCTAPAGGADPEVRRGAAQCQMVISDTLNSLKLLGEYLVTGDHEQAAGCCDRISNTLLSASELALFERLPSIDLPGAIDNLAGLRASFDAPAIAGEGRTEIKVSVVSVNCTACGSDQDGFLNDPRDGTFDCESCGAKFHVGPDSLISFG